jgi:hypothetical protein
MSKLFLTLLFFFISCVLSIDLKKIQEEATEFTKKLMEDLDEKWRKITEEKEALVNTTSTLEKIDRGIEYFQQSAQIHNLYGIKDSQFSAFLSAYFKSSNLSPEFLGLVKDKLLELTLERNNDWKSFKFLYSKNDTINNITTCVYSCILAQHDNPNKKINWIYTNIESSFEIQDVFILTTTEIKNGEKTETQNIVHKPSKFEQDELSLIIDFFEVVAYKTFGKHFGIESTTDVADLNKNGIPQLFFLQ